MALSTLFRKTAAQVALRQIVHIQARLATVQATRRDLLVIGNRDIVGYGINGEPVYADLFSHPFPAIRFKENTPDIMAIREKEKGDWKKLTIEEKKALYRASFCQTFAEMKAPTGEWKSVVGLSLMWVAFTLWLFYLISVYVLHPLPKSTQPEYEKAQLERMIKIGANPISGVASKWDYEKNDWKD